MVALSKVELHRRPFPLWCQLVVKRTHHPRVLIGVALVTENKRRDCSQPKRAERREGSISKVLISVSDDGWYAIEKNSLRLGVIPHFFKHPWISTSWTPTNRHSVIRPACTQSTPPQLYTIKRIYAWTRGVVCCYVSHPFSRVSGFHHNSNPSAA